METILVTGANGFVGQYLVRDLLEKGYTVVAAGRGAAVTANDHPSCHYLSFDFTDDAAVQQAMREFKPGRIIHSGAMSKPDDCELNRELAWKINVQGTINLLNAAAAAGSHFTFLSTDFVFDGVSGFYKEDDSRNPVNYYGETKMLAEDEVFASGTSWSVVRTVLVYGSTRGSRQNIITNVALSLKEGKEVKIFSDQLRTPTYVEDLSAGIVATTEKIFRGIIHISGEDVRTPYQMAVETAAALGYDASLVKEVREGDFEQPARRPAKTRFDITKAKTELGYSPVSFPEGLKKTLKDYLI